MDAIVYENISGLNFVNIGRIYDENERIRREHIFSDVDDRCCIIHLGGDSSNGQHAVGFCDGRRT
jgi:hypothetical protein